jgi:hypothetical protein
MNKNKRYSLKHPEKIARKNKRLNFIRGKCVQYIRNKEPQLIIKWEKEFNAKI